MSHCNTEQLLKCQRLCIFGLYGAIQMLLLLLLLLTSTAAKSPEASCRLRTAESAALCEASKCRCIRLLG